MTTRAAMVKLAVINITMRKTAKRANKTLWTVSSWKTAYDS